MFVAVSSFLGMRSPIQCVNLVVAETVCVRSQVAGITVVWWLFMNYIVYIYVRKSITSTVQIFVVSK